MLKILKYKIKFSFTNLSGSNQLKFNPSAYLSNSIEVKKSIKKENLIFEKSKVSSFDRQIKNEPFIKNLFCGKYIYDYLKYPEYEKSYKLNKLNDDFIEPIKNYFNSTNYEEIIDKDGNFSLAALEKFKFLKLYSSSLPSEYGGTELDSIGFTRILEETGIYPK